MLKTVAVITGTVTNGTVTQVQGNGTVNGITLTGNVTTSGNLTLGGTLSGVTNAQLQNSAVTIGNTTISLGSTATTIGNLTLGNVTITGGTISDNTVTANSFVGTGNILSNSNIGVFSYGNLSYSDTGVVASYASSVNSYVQIVAQNLSNANQASTDFTIVNDTGTAYGDFGITSSTYSGTIVLCRRRNYSTRGSLCRGLTIAKNNYNSTAIDNPVLITTKRTRRYLNRRSSSSSCRYNYCVTARREWC